MNPIAILDLASVIISIAVFYQAHETQKAFGGLFKPAFAIFYSIGVLSLSLAMLEISGFLVPDATVSTMALHVVMFAILILMLLGLFLLSPKSVFGTRK
jgi:hypothetical protein